MHTRSMCTLACWRAAMVEYNGVGERGSGASENERERTDNNGERVHTHARTHAMRTRALACPSTGLCRYDKIHTHTNFICVWGTLHIVYCEGF